MSKIVEREVAKVVEREVAKVIDEQKRQTVNIIERMVEELGKLTSANDKAIEEQTRQTTIIIERLQKELGKLTGANEKVIDEQTRQTAPNDRLQEELSTVSTVSADGEAEGGPTQVEAAVHGSAVIAAVVDFIVEADEYEIGERRRGPWGPGTEYYFLHKAEKGKEFAKEVLSLIDDYPEQKERLGACRWCK